MDIRAITLDESDAFRAALQTVFGLNPAGDPEGADRFRDLVDVGRAFAAFDRGQIVATSATFDFTLTVPGGTIPLSGLTQVTVRPSHRRRGILRGLIDAHVAAHAARGVAVSGLWASESSIYGRFGYGMAAEGDHLTFSAPGLSLAGGPSDEIEMLDDGAAELLPPIYDAVRLARPGMMSRSPAWWRHRRFADRPDLMKGASPRRSVITRQDGAPTGYVTYRQRIEWDHGVSAGGVEIEELVATDARAELNLWRYVFGIDLFPKITWWNAPVDSPLPFWVSDPRRLRRQRLDSLWLRIDDVPAALVARRYGADGRLALAVEGRTYGLVVDAGAARCVASEAPADLTLGREALGNLYLGGARASLLARAGRVIGSPRAIELADRMFAAPVAPWCAEIF